MLMNVGLVNDYDGVVQCRPCNKPRALERSDMYTPVQHRLPLTKTQLTYLLITYLSPAAADSQCSG